MIKFWVIDFLFHVLEKMEQPVNFNLSFTFKFSNKIFTFTIALGSSCNSYLLIILLFVKVPTMIHCRELEYYYRLNFWLV
jgi:hypothetical protein